MTNSKIGFWCVFFLLIGTAKRLEAGAFNQAIVPTELIKTSVWSVEKRAEVSKVSEKQSKEVRRKLKKSKKQRSKTDGWYDRNKNFVWGLTIAVGLLGMIGFGLGIGLSLTWLWILGLSLFPLLIVWVFVGGLIENNLVHLTTLLIVGWFLFGFGIEAVVLGLLFTIPWVWIMGGIVGLIFGAFSITQAILIGI